MILAKKFFEILELIFEPTALSNFKGKFIGIL